MRKVMSKSKSAPVGVIGKVLRILELLDHSPYGLQLKDIAAMTGINKSTAHRFLSHLEAESYLFRDAAGTYMLGTRLARLGSGASFQGTLCRTCRPILENLRSVTGETVNLAMLEGTKIVYLDVLESQQTFKYVSPVGMRRPAHRTSLGKAILANLPDAQQKEEVISSIEATPDDGQKAINVSRFRKELLNICELGFALDDEESAIGARCVGAAIFDAEGKVVGGISISGPIVRLTKGRLPFFSAEVCKAAREISWRLGNRVRKGEKSIGLTTAEPSKQSPSAKLSRSVRQSKSNAYL